MTETALVHGMEGELVQPDWPVLRLDELQLLLNRFPEAGTVEEILSYSPRPFSSASIVRTSRGQLFVKRHHHSVRNREELLEEHRLLRYLHSHGGRVVEILTDEHGESVIEDGVWSYEVHRQAAGLDLYKDAHSWTPFRSTAHASAAGKALADLHLAAEGYSAPRRQARTLTAGFHIFSQLDPWPALELYVGSHHELSLFLDERDWRKKVEDALLPWHRKLMPYLDALPPLWTHNDLHASNLLWSEESDEADVVSVIDFGLSDCTTAACDLANAIERNCIRWLEPEGDFNAVVQWKQIHALLDAYDKVRPLSRKEAESIAAILPLVHAEFALSETDYFLRILKSEENAALGWDGYCLDHAHWFTTGTGQRLLQELNQWAEKR